MRVLRSASWILLLGIGLAACDLNPPEPQAQPPPQIITTGQPAASPSPQLLAIWVLWPLGVNVHLSPGTSAPVAGAAQQTTQLDVDGSRVLNGQTWLQVRATDQSGLKGWVLDDPGLVIHRSIDLQINSDQSWSMAFPTGWTVNQASGPSGVTTVSGDQDTMTVDVETPTPKFTPPAAFLSSRQIEVYGKTTVLSTYRTGSGGYEFVTRLQWDAQRYFTITFSEPAGPQPDASLCLQLITGIKVD